MAKRMLSLFLCLLLCAALLPAAAEDDSFFSGLPIQSAAVEEAAPTAAPSAAPSDAATAAPTAAPTATPEPTAMPELPTLTEILAEDSVLMPGEEWYVEFQSSVAGTVTATLISLADGAFYAELGKLPVEEGLGRLTWDGYVSEDAPLSNGMWGIVLQLIDAQGLESVAQVVAFEVTGSSAAPLEPEPTPSPAPTATPEPTRRPVPTASSFWDMDPDDYDLTDPDHQQAIWDIMMQPMTVLDKGEREHVYATFEAGASLTPRTNIAGELHGTSQGVNVLSGDEDGYTLVEAYSNDGLILENSYVESLNAKRIQGYVRTSLLKEVAPSDKYALLIDKLTQTLYIFEDGKIIGELLCSTGRNTSTELCNETPAGEFFVVSWVGEFVSGSGSGTMYCDLALRINSGILIHEVPYKKGGDGVTRMYSYFEPYLGTKASHGCIRVQRARNEEGQNMQWLWDHLKRNTKVLIWDDKGRTMPAPEIPSDDLQLYRNPDGGSMYHTVAECPNVKKRFLPLTGDFTYGDLNTPPFDELTPCPDCGAPQRKETILQNWVNTAVSIGAEIPEGYLTDEEIARIEAAGVEIPAEILGDGDQAGEAIDGDPREDDI